MQRKNVLRPTNSDYKAPNQAENVLDFENNLIIPDKKFWKRLQTPGKTPKEVIKEKIQEYINRIWEK